LQVEIASVIALTHNDRRRNSLAMTNWSIGEFICSYKNMVDIIANQRFPIALQILFIFRIYQFMQETVTAQKNGYREILENNKKIHNTITTLKASKNLNNFFFL